jgi:hypothetical protein
MDQERDGFGAGKVNPDVSDPVAGVSDGFYERRAVGLFPDSMSPVGCLDMGDNFMEWTTDDTLGDFVNWRDDRIGFRLVFSRPAV